MPVIDLGSVVGPQGPQGATGATGAQGIQGNPGPNQVTDQTSTNLNGVLFGNQSRVTVKPVDSTPTADSTNLVSSGGVKTALDTKANQAQLAYVENGTTASRAYAVGEYFCWNGLLYRAKTAIGNGDTFTVNTNCEVVPAGLANEVIQQTVDTAAGTVNPDITARVLGTLTKIGKTATINIIIEIKPGATVTTNEFYTLPAGFRPKNTLYCGGTLGENPFAIFMTIRSDGQIIQSTWSSRYFSSYQWIVLNGTFLTE